MGGLFMAGRLPAFRCFRYCGSVDDCVDEVVDSHGGAFGHRD